MNNNNNNSNNNNNNNVLITLFFFFNRWKSCFKQRRPTPNDILKAVENDQFFGAVEVDISVPDEWPAELKQRADFTQKFGAYTPYEYFEEMCPLFLNTEVTFEDIGEHMQQHVNQFNLSKHPRRLLIGGLRAEKVLLASPLLRWYINHGLRVTKVSVICKLAAEMITIEFFSDHK